uniref:Uncharacterized protein n=1 Tax=Ceratitis capitata TaxID=7213 RepID=W8BMN6_CERCA
MLRRCDFRNQSQQSLDILLGRQLTASAMAVVSSVHKVRQSKLYLLAAATPVVANINTDNNTHIHTCNCVTHTKQTTTIIQQRNSGDTVGVVAESNDNDNDEQNDDHEGDDEVKYDDFG